MSDIWAAAHQGDLVRLEELLNSGEDPNAHQPASKSAYRPTPLAYAVWGDQPDALRLLLEHGGDPNRADGDGNYHPLHWAVYKGDHADCAQLLVDAGADVMVRTLRGFTALELARGQNELVGGKPFVASVLEDAQRYPRPPWDPPSPRTSTAAPPTAAAGGAAPLLPPSAGAAPAFSTSARVWLEASASACISVMLILAISAAYVFITLAYMSAGPSGAMLNCCRGRKAGVRGEREKGGGGETRHRQRGAREMGLSHLWLQAHDHEGGQNVERDDDDDQPGDPVLLLGAHDAAGLGAGDHCVDRGRTL